MSHFADILDYEFTANVEADFDKVAAGKKVWNEAIAAFYKPFRAHVDEVLSERGSGKVTREIGIAPDGEKVIAAFGKFGPYVQKGEGEKRQSASLGKGQLIETLTLEEALKLLELPRTVGQIDGVDVVATRGRFGPYIKFGDRNVTLPRGKDPLTVSLEECRALIQEAAQPKTPAAPIAEFGDIKVLNGRYGPYIKQGESNYKIPKGRDAASLTEADCQAIINASTPTKKSYGRRKK